MLSHAWQSFRTTLFSICGVTKRKDPPTQAFWGRFQQHDGFWECLTNLDLHFRVLWNSLLILKSSGNTAFWKRDGLVCPGKDLLTWERERGATTETATDTTFKQTWRWFYRTPHSVLGLTHPTHWEIPCEKTLSPLKYVPPKEPWPWINSTNLTEDC